MISTMPYMLMEFVKLAVGLAIALFHRPLADYIMVYERALVVHFRQRGVMVPNVLTAQFAYNVYFSLGIFTAVYEIGRIWMLLHGVSN